MLILAAQHISANHLCPRQCLAGVHPAPLASPSPLLVQPGQQSPQSKRLAEYVSQFPLPRPPAVQGTAAEFLAVSETPVAILSSVTEYRLLLFCVLWIG